MEEVSVIIFMGCCIFLPMILSTIPKQQTVIKKEVVEVVKYMPPPPHENVVVENPIKKEAIECLVSLGMKKSQAKKKVFDMFEKTDYKSIEGFLMDVYKV
jgi:predicted transcriptional regulator